MSFSTLRASALASSVVAGLADRVTVLQFGRILTEGTYDEVRNNPSVIEAYLGGESAA